MAGIAAGGIYLPWRRLERAAVAAAHKWLNPALGGRGRGTRAMASWDEDVITMGVEAARNVLAGLDRQTVNAVYLASTTAPFADRQNAAIVAGALGLSEGIASADFGGSQRAGTTALIAALNAAAATGQTGLVASAERRHALAASPQEMQIGDAGAALLVTAGDGLAQYLGGISTTTDFIDHYRQAGSDIDYQWEERWVRDEGVKKIVPAAIAGALEKLGVAAVEIGHFLLPASLGGVEADIAAGLGIAKTAIRPSYADQIGDSGAAHPVLMLALALEEARPAEKILLVGFGQGCDVLLFETTQAVGREASTAPFAAQLGRGKSETNYLRYLIFNEMLEWEKGKRAERDKPTALSTHYRKRDMLNALSGGECCACGTKQFPLTRICVNPNCNKIDTQAPYSFADRSAKILSWSADHLVFTPDPPLHYGTVTFRDGGRILVEFTDCEPGDVNAGVEVRMVFRVKDFDTQRGFRRYFWKAAPVRAQKTGEH